jgi:molecular chaperone DnaK (HSP70)
MIVISFQGQTKKLYPEEISAMVLQKINKIAEDYLGKDVKRY